MGHVLMDLPGVSVDGIGEHWPTAARARAFGVMLLLPEEGIRETLSQRVRSIDSEAVVKLMDTYRTGPYATTYHLLNLGLIDDERRYQILGELAH